MDEIVVGIDLGTTFSAVAYVNDEGDVEAIPNADDKLLTPSAVLVEGDRIEVGDIALNQWVTNEEHVVRWIKRAMGNPEYHFQGLSPVEISAEILKSLKADAEAFLGVSLEEAVITCPAYFAAVEIENTKRAGELAGFQVREIVKEPTAAAVYYGIEKMEDGEAVMVCDLGGGTYDATILSFESGVFVPRASMGDRMLGGHDWTMELLELAAQRLREVFGEDPRNDLMTGQLLYEACEQAKRDFARTETVAIPCRFKDQIEQVTITRDEFETQTEYLIQSLVMWSEHALEKARMTWDDIDRILMVGGASRLRRMGLALEKSAGKTPILSPRPDLIVALGAAVLARGRVRARGGLTDRVSGGLIDVDYRRINTRSLGTRAIVFEGNKARITNALIIPHGTGTPVSRSRDDFELASTGQKIFEVPVVEFESDDDYDLVGNYQFTCLPDAKRGDRIEVTFNYDVSGIVDVEAVDVGSGRALACERLLAYEDPDIDEVVKVGIRPQCVVYALDVSSSMRGHKIAEAKRAVIDTACDLLSACDQCKVGMVTFASTVCVACRPTSDVTKIKSVVSSLEASGMTAMDDGIHQAVELVLGTPAGLDRYVVMVTDGMPDPGRRSSTQAAAEQAKAAGVILSALGIGHEDVDESFLRSLTPISFVIEASENMIDAVGRILRLAREEGLKEVQGGGLHDMQKRRARG
jgi:molecular chaperone DnaK